MNFLYESSEILYDVCSEFLDCTFKFDPPRLLPAVAKIYKYEKVDKYSLFEAAKKIYYECYNALNNLKSNYFYDCMCHRFEGWESYIGFKEYSLFVELGILIQRANLTIILTKSWHYFQRLQIFFLTLKNVLSLINVFFLELWLSTYVERHFFRYIWWYILKRLWFL